MNWGEKPCARIKPEVVSPALARRSEKCQDTVGQTVSRNRLALAEQGMGKLPPNTYNAMRTVTEGKPKRTLVPLIGRSQVRILMGVLSYDDVRSAAYPL